MAVEALNSYIHSFYTVPVVYGNLYTAIYIYTNLPKILCIVIWKYYIMIPSLKAERGFRYVYAKAHLNSGDRSYVSVQVIPVSSWEQ